MTSWREEKRPTASVERIDVAELHERDGDVQILDVRERAEWDAGPHPRLDLHALPRPHGDPRRHRPVAADRRHLLLRPAQRGRGLAAHAPRRRARHPRRRRRRRHVGAQRLADRPAHARSSAGAERRAPSASSRAWSARTPRSGLHLAARHSTWRRRCAPACAGTPSTETSQTGVTCELQHVAQGQRAAVVEAARHRRGGSRAAGRPGGRRARARGGPRGPGRCRTR